MLLFCNNSLSLMKNGRMRMATNEDGLAPIIMFGYDYAIMSYESYRPLLQIETRKAGEMK